MNQTEEKYCEAASTRNDISQLIESRSRYIQKRELRIREKQAKKRQAIVVLIWLIVITSVMFSVWAALPMLTNSRTVDETVQYDYSSSPTPTHAHSETTMTSTPSADIASGKESPSTEKQYMQLDYYIEENSDRYRAYASVNPSMSPEDIVWRVNANLDKPKYSYTLPASDSDDPLIIVNKYYKVPEDFSPDDLQSFDGQMMRRETGEAYTKMRNAASAEGLSIRAVSAYRSVEYQRNLYNSYLASDSFENVERYSARPGHSEHHTGMAIDLFGSVDGLRNFINTPEYPWVKENAYKFGFIIRYTQTGEEITGYEFEPWHIRYVGTKVSTAMKRENIETYEEYYAKHLLKKSQKGYGDIQ